MAVSEQTDSLRVLGSDPVRAPPNAFAATLVRQCTALTSLRQSCLHMCMCCGQQCTLVVRPQGRTYALHGPTLQLVHVMMLLGRARLQPICRWTTW